MGPEDLNPQPRDYESPALTVELQARIVSNHSIFLILRSPLTTCFKSDLVMASLGFSFVIACLAHSLYSRQFIGPRPYAEPVVKQLLNLDFDGDGESAAHAKRLGRDLQDRSGLLALVLGALHKAHHLLDKIE